MKKAPKKPRPKKRPAARTAGGEPLWRLSAATLGLDFSDFSLVEFLNGAGQWARRWGAIFLLPAWLFTAVALLKLLGSAQADGLWLTAPLWFFSLGVVLWCLHFYRVGKPVKAYVWGHEATHALFVYVCGGRVHEFHVSAQGGHVLTNRNNWLIALSPYFVPLYAMAGAVVFWVVGKFIDLEAWRSIGLTLLPGLRLQWLMHLTLGILWAFHLTFTFWMIRRDQPDLTTNNTFFSINIIVLGNLLVLCLLLGIATPELTLGGFLSIWKEAAIDVVEFFGRIVVEASSLL